MISIGGDSRHTKKKWFFAVLCLVAEEKKFRRWKMALIGLWCWILVCFNSLGIRLGSAYLIPSAAVPVLAPPNISLPEMTNLSPFVLRLSFPLRFIKSCLLRPSPTRNARRGSYEISFLQLGELRSLNRDKIIFFVPRLFHLGMEGCCRRIVICSPVLLLLMPVV